MSTFIRLKKNLNRTNTVRLAFVNTTGIKNADMHKICQLVDEI